MTPPELNHSGSLIHRGGLIEAALPKSKKTASFFKKRSLILYGERPCTDSLDPG